SRTPSPAALAAPRWKTCRSPSSTRPAPRFRDRGIRRLRLPAQRAGPGTGRWQRERCDGAWTAPVGVAGDRIRFRPCGAVVPDYGAEEWLLMWERIYSRMNSLPQKSQNALARRQLDQTAGAFAVQLQFGQRAGRFDMQAVMPAQLRGCLAIDHQAHPGFGG